MKIKTENDIPSNWTRLTARKKTTVKIRPCNGVETFKVSWQDSELVSDPEVDLIIIQSNGKEYPIKRDIFSTTYTIVEPFGSLDYIYDYNWIKSATTQLVAIPEGEEVEIETLEGTLPKVTYPDYIVIGVKGELYANTQEFVKNNLEIV
jgi:hypothetical protein